MAVSEIDQSDVRCQMQEQGGDCTIGQQSSSNRCDSLRCTVCNCSTRPICPRNRLAMQCGRRLASHQVCCAGLILRASCTQQIMTQGFGRLTAPVRPAAALVPRARQYVVCRGPFQTLKAALGLQPAASAVSLGSFICQMQEEGGGNYTIEQQSSGNRCDSRRFSVRSSSARPSYPRNRRVVQR